MTVWSKNRPLVGNDGEKKIKKIWVQTWVFDIFVRCGIQMPSARAKILGPDSAIGKLKNMRFVALLSIGLCCFTLTGCLGTLARLVTDPAGTTSAAGQGVAQRAVQNLTNGQAGTMIQHSDTIRHMGDMLQDNPHATNSASLEELKAELRAQQQADAQNNQSLEIDENGMVNPPNGEPFQPTDYDRRRQHLRSPQNSYQLARQGEGGLYDVNHDRHVAHVPTEVPNDPSRRLRSRDPWRFVMPPNRSTENYRTSRQTFTIQNQP